jgi:hypothetical protein
MEIAMKKHPRWITAVLAIAAFGLWSASAVPADFTRVLRGAGAVSISRIILFEHYFYVFVALGCALLFLIRPRYELSIVLIGAAIGLVYPLFSLCWTLQHTWGLEQYYRRTQPYYSPWIFWLPLLTMLTCGAAAGGVAGMFRWICLDPDHAREVSAVRLSLRALLLWLATLPATFMIQKAFGFRFMTPPEVGTLVPRALLLAWTAGTTWIRSQRPRIELMTASAIVLGLLACNVGLPFSFVVPWLLWNLCMIAVSGPRVTDAPGHPSAIDRGVLILSAPALVLPLLGFIPFVGFFLTLLVGGSIYIVSWAAVALTLVSTVSRAAPWRKLTSLFLAAASLWFSYRLLEQSRHLF